MTIKVVVKEPGKLAEVREIENTLKAKQKIVGGYIEVIRVPHLDSQFVMILNEEGKLINLPPNLLIPGDVIVGTAFVEKCALDGESFGLTDSEADEVCKLLNRMSL